MGNLSSDEQPKQFEDFISKNGTADIFQKMYDLEAVLEEGTPKYLDGLGLQILTPAAPSYNNQGKRQP